MPTIEFRVVRSRRTRKLTLLGEHQSNPVSRVPVFGRMRESDIPRRIESATNPKR